MGNFHLAEGVYLIGGSTRGALCDTRSGNVFSLNATAKLILEGKLSNDTYWEELLDQGLVVRTEGKVFTGNELPKNEIKLEFIWFEILADDCNERCAHCYAESMPPTYRREMNLLPLEKTITTKKEEKLTYHQWTQVIDESYELGCRRGQFIGGEPFLYKGENGKTVLDLAEHAIQLGYGFIEIFTNATLLTGRKVERIKDLGISIAVSLYSDDPDIHDGITRTPGSHKKTMIALQRLQEADIPTRVETVLMRPNQQTIGSTIKLVENMGFEHRSPDVLRPKGRGDNPFLIPDPEIVARYGLMTKPNFYADTSFFTRSCSGHNCMAGKIAVTESGDVLPCIFSRDQNMGNLVARGSLKEVIRGNALQTVWLTTKDDVLVCQDCEYRYVCFDCRPISGAVAGENGDYLTAPYPRCTYNPYIGEWGGGVWRLDNNGQPYYDESLAPIIEKITANESSVAFPIGD